MWLTQLVQLHYGTIRSIQQEQYVLTTVKEMKHFLVKKCVAMSLTAIIYNHIEDINLSTSSTLNNILTIGNYFYTSIRCSVQTNDYLLLTDVPCMVSIYNKVYTLEYSESLTGSLFKASNNGPYMSLQNSLTSVFKLST